MFKTLSLEEIHKATRLFHLAMSKSRKVLDKSMACSKKWAEFLQVLVCCVCYNSWDKYGTFSSITTKVILRRISKKKASRILFLYIKKMVIFPFVKGKLKITALWRLAQLKQIILTPVLLATPSVILAAKCEACQQHKEIQPGRQL